MVHAMRAPHLQPPGRARVHPHRAATLLTAQSSRIALLANGRRHGAITRLIAPWEIGERTTPFVLLNYLEAERRQRPLMGVHPPTGIATLTVVLNGELSFEDASGRRGEVAAAGLAWMKAGGVLWHEGGDAMREPLRIFHLWVEQPAAPAELATTSECIGPDEVEADGPVRVLLGEYGHARSRIRQARAELNFLHVQLKDGEHFRYTAPAEHNLAWLALDRGGLQFPDGGRVLWEQIALFSDAADPIEVQADGEASFVLGSARRPPWPAASTKVDARLPRS
jgi:redox-sensitive bicupin YhaK (pirin superfamily)